MRGDPQALWKELAQAQRDRPTEDRPNGFQMFNRTADEMARVLAERLAAAEALCGDDGEWRGPRNSVKRPSCSECGASNLEHFFSMRALGSVLCPTCFGRRHQPAT